MNEIEANVVRIGTFASVAIHWLPNILLQCRRAPPASNIKCYCAATTRWRAESVMGESTALFYGFPRCRSSTPNCSSKTNAKSFYLQPSSGEK